MAEKLKVELIKTLGVLQFANLRDEVVCNYEITDLKKGTAKLRFELEIESGAYEVDDTYTDANELTNFLCTDENTSNRISMTIAAKACKLATTSDNAELSFVFKLYGKTPGSLGSKTPGNSLEIEGL